MKSIGLYISRSIRSVIKDIDTGKCKNKWINTRILSTLHRNCVNVTSVVEIHHQTVAFRIAPQGIVVTTENLHSNSFLHAVLHIGFFEHVALVVDGFHFLYFSKPIKRAGNHFILDEIRQLSDRDRSWSHPCQFLHRRPLLFDYDTAKIVMQSLL